MIIKIAFSPNPCGIARSCSGFCKVRFEHPSASAASRWLKPEQ